MPEPLQEQETEPIESSETSTATKQDKTGKTFTQRDVNEMVQTRLSRAENGFQKERDAWEAERTATADSTKALQKIVRDAVFTVLTNRMLPTEKSLFEKLPFEEQLKMAQSEEFLASLNQKTTTPTTPKTAEQPKTLFKRITPL